MHRMAPMSASLIHERTAVCNDMEGVVVRGGSHDCQH